MRRFLHRHIPSMFRRRLALLLLIVVAVTLLLGLRTASLTLGKEHQQRRDAAERVLVKTFDIPTVRGQILDRRGRVLAIDEPGFDVAVAYEVITGQWAYLQAKAEARKLEIWGELGRVDQQLLTEKLLPLYQQQVERLWQTLADLAGVDREQIEQRKGTILRRVDAISSGHTAGRVDTLSKKWDVEVSWFDAAQTVKEETWHHWILRDVDDPTRKAVQELIVAAQRQKQAFDDAKEAGQTLPDQPRTVWLELALPRPNQRRYPFQTITLKLDRAHLPSVLRSDQAQEITVQGVGRHIIGMMRNVWKEDVQRRPYSTKTDMGLGGYLPGDRTGSFGIERSYEEKLRGLRGQRTLHRDARQSDTLPPRRGEDVHLTIDVQLQARIAAIMSQEFGLMQTQSWHSADAKVGTPLNGAAVVMSVDTAEVLAAVSVPGITLEQLRKDGKSLAQDHMNQPLVNRPVARPYQPGSTIKPLVLVSAVTEGKFSLDQTIDCQGMLDPAHPDHFRCWIYNVYLQVHGPLHASDALMHSCNIFFYTLGRRMGSQRLAQWYGKFALGTRTGSGLIEEVSGDLPDLSKYTGPKSPGFSAGDAINMGIGQGPVRWTPIQAAAAYAAIGRHDGKYLGPTFVRDDDRDGAGIHRQPRKPSELQLNAAAVDAALEGLDKVANSPQGTGHHIRLNREPIFDVQGVTVLGKSGTAQAVPLREPIDDDGDGKPDGWGDILRRGDHAWFIVLVGPEGESPTYVVAVVAEFAGSGGQVSGPIVNQIIHALQLEGYLR